MTTQLKVGVVGGLGMMSSPMARHWSIDGPVQVARVHDRGGRGELKDAYRQAWREHGAELVSELSDVAAFDGCDGVFVCCGKNGDDLPIIVTLARAMRGRQQRAFLCHLSTVSVEFVEAADVFCRALGVDYVNYPLTGGPLGAEKATMLILCGGDFALYERLLPALSKLGVPRYFGANPAAASKVKLIGHMMVFNGLIGISSAAALHAECFQGGVLGGAQQGEFFDFLNAGGGGTRQWEVALSAGVRNDIWNAGFFLNHAVIDAIYAARLALEHGTASLTVRPLLDVALAFSFILNNTGVSLATHSIVRELIASRAGELDKFMRENSAPSGDLEGCLEMCIRSLPPALQGQVALNISLADFERCYNGA
ncbi:MAG: NAD(P)-binding domain-containing protein [Pseudomonadota bacterium]